MKSILGNMLTLWGSSGLSQVGIVLPHDQLYVYVYILEWGVEEKKGIRIFYFFLIIFFYK